MSPRADAPHPAAVGLVWRIGASLGAVALAAALELWRSDALQAQELAALRADLASARAEIAAHVESDRRREESQSEREREAHVAQARLAASVDAAMRYLDAIVPPRRRGPG